MQPIYQLVYASKANINLGTTGINPEVSRILLKSKSNNAKRMIGGVLYYADGYFFQVLEGDPSSVKGLYQKIIQDNRHSDSTILIEGEIDRPQFSNWSMHFVASDSGIRQLLQDNGYKQFSPFKMSVAQIQGLIAVLSNNGVYERTDSRKIGLSKKVKSFFFKHKTA